MTSPYEIRLIINRQDNAYTAKWVDFGGQESQPFPLTLPLTADDAAELRWYLEGYLQFPGAGDHKRAENVEAKLNTWGHALFDAVFGTAAGTNVYRNLMDAERDGQLGLITLGAVDPDVLVQPWEMMRDGRGVLALRGVTLRRQLQGAKPSPKFNLALPLRILLIVSRPSDVGFIDPRNSLPPVLEARDQLAGQAVVEFCDPPTLTQLEKMISEARKAQRPYHLVHFDGHGTYLPMTGVGALVFEDAEAKTDLVTGTRFGDLLARLEVPLVLLEACRGADLSNKPVFGSLAPALLESGVGSVVAFSHSVHIRAARILVERFYKELATGQSVGAALQEARAALLADPARFLHLGPNAESINLQDWFIPQLYQVGLDPILIPSPAAPVKGGVPGGDAPSARLYGFPPPPLYRFHGRALELLEIERAFRKYNAIVVTGMGGMGKTALAREAAAWWLHKGRFDSAVFISFEQKAGAERAVQLIGQALEGDDFSRRSGDEADPQGQWQTAVRLFHEQRALVVWDNFESTLPIYQSGETSPPGPLSEAERGSASPSPVSGEGRGGGLTSCSSEARARLAALYRALTEGTPRSRLLVTCRPEDTSLPAIKEFPLHGLARPDSLYLLAAVLDLKGINIERPGYERAEIDGLLTMLADHPLSIELIAPHLKTLTPAEIRKDFTGLLERFANTDAKEDRNKSLLAALEFSRQRLSQAAQQALPWLAWFEGGAFEISILNFTQLTPESWAAIRAELVATALIEVEELEEFSSPYLRFHPTLPYAARPGDVPDPEAAEKRFIGVYLAVRQAANNALHGQQPAEGMALMAREEANFRRALERALLSGARGEGQALASTLRNYLERAGRNRERDALTAWVQEHLPADVLDKAACDSIRDHAWTRFTQGTANEAVQMVQDLLARLQTEGLAGGADPAFQIALTYRRLGLIYVNAGRPDLALEPAQQAITRFEQLVDRRGLQDRVGLDAEKGNLSAALGDLANAYRDLGQFDEALTAAERALAIDRELKRDREIAAGLGQIASILAAQHRYPEAEALYAEALRAAQAAGDLELQGKALQHQASLHDEQGNHARAVDLFKQALALFQRANAPGDEMQICDLLASAEMLRGQLDAAEAWYTRSRQLAVQLNDRAQLAATAQNVGILYQIRAEQSAKQADPTARAGWLRKAIASVEESLAIKLERQNQMAAASSYGQLGVLHRMVGDLDHAEQNTLKSLQICESLNLPDVYRVYSNLALIARDRGDAEAAARWQAKHDAKREELDQLERGEGTTAGAQRVDERLVKHILQLAQTCYTIRANYMTTPPDVAEALAQLAAAPAPLNDVGAFLQAVAVGQPMPPVPAGLPDEINEILEQLAKAVRAL